MTEDIGSDKHRSNPEIKMAVLEERMKEARERDRALLASNAEVKDAVNDIKLMLAKGEMRMKAIETSQEDTTTRILVLENDKRSTAGIVAGTISALGTIATVIWVALKGGGNGSAP